MKKSSLVLLSLATLLTLSLFSGCNDGKLTSIEYNNEVVDILNSTSAAIEETTLKYDEAIPNIVSEDSKIDVETLKMTGKDAEAKLEEANKVLTLQSREMEQEAAIKDEFNRYMELGQGYMTTYNEMVAYYEKGDFSKNLDGVEQYDEKLHTQYNDFINSNNTLVDILGNFVE